jgi:SET domain-containing protein
MTEPKLYAIKRSTIGLGLFAIAPIPKGVRIIEYTGIRIPGKEIEGKTGKYFFELNKRWVIDGSARANVARYINHSCQPNAEALVTGQRIWIWSSKTISAGEEITSDYGKEYFDEIISAVGCKCQKCG